MALDDPRALARAPLDHFWVRLRLIEERHREARRTHEVARRRLEASRGTGDPELRQSWAAYCEAIAGLDDVTSELEQFRGGAIQAFSE